MKLKHIVPIFVLAATTLAAECSVAAIEAALPQNSTVTFIYHIAVNGTLNSTITGGQPLPAPLPCCVVQVNVPTSGNTSYNFGLILPDEWNQRFLAVGNAGFAGSINWNSLIDGLGYGFAVVSTDTGHSSSPIDASWAYNQPEKVINWGYRALHGSVVAGKAITKKYYGQSIAFNYYRGCSAGGKQGLREIQMFPDDFDGVVAGAPAWWTTHLQLWNGIVGYWNTPTGSPHYVNPALFPILGAEVLKQCDAQDGVVDNIIMDPIRCLFRPEKLLCLSNTTTNSTVAQCLTPPQIDTVYKWYNDWVEANQTFIFPHFMPGSEWQWPTPVGLLGDTSPSPLGTSYIQYMLGLGPGWNWSQWSPGIVALSDKLNPGNATADDFDLSPFYRKGGKLLHYHGLADGSIATGSSIYFYDHVLRTLQPQGIHVDDFYRFFLIPGMGHCGGTSPASQAPFYIAGDGQASSGTHSVPGFANRHHDILLAVMAWVENGTAPNEIIATAYGATTSEVLRQRPLCVYPKQAFYDGHGNVNHTENWHCKSLY